MVTKVRHDRDFGEIMEAKVTAKRILGHGLGTRMDWLCVVADGGFGWGRRKSLTCVDMTVHAIERGHPNVIFSQVMDEPIRRRHFMPNAPDTPEQRLLAERIRKEWPRLKNNQLIKLKKKELEQEMDNWEL